METQVIDSQKIVLNSVGGGVRAIEFLHRPASVSFMEKAGVALAECFSSGGKLLVAGNGGSLCDAMHFAEELTGQFRKRRRALPAIALGDPGHMTCTANDMGFDQVFARGVEAYGQPGDVLAVLTTSGNSPNLLEAVRVAKEREMTVIAFLGKSGGKLKGISDLELLVEGFATSDRIQEAHMTAIHIIIEVIEHILFYAEK